MKVTVKTPGGPLSFRFDSSSSVQAGMQRDLLGDGYEPTTWRWLCEHVQPGMRVIDVGAHVGVFTCLMARLVGPTGHVWAYEPHPQNRTHLLQHVRDNALTNVTVKKQAVSDVAGDTVLHHNADNDGGHALYDVGRLGGNPKSRERPKASRVKTVRLDDHHTDIQVLKIDTEGAEFNVLKGAEKLLRTHQPAVIAEVNVPGLRLMGTCEDDWRAWMRNLGYQEFALLDEGPKAMRNDETCSRIIQQDGQNVVPIWNCAFVATESESPR